MSLIYFTILSQLIQIRSQHFVIVPADIIVTKIVGQEDDNIVSISDIQNQ